jgi:glycosyltransferase involved in cell wall biosynthesis
MAETIIRKTNRTDTRKQSNILFISEQFTGLDSFLLGRAATGMPAVYLLLTALVKEEFQIYWMLMGRDPLGRHSFDLMDGKIHVICCQPIGAKIFDAISTSKLVHLKLPQIALGLAGLLKALQILRKVRPNLVYGSTPMAALVSGVLAKLYHLPRISRLYGSLLYFYKLQGRWEWLYYHYPAEIAVFKWPGDALILTNDGTRSNQLAKRFRSDPEKMFFLLNGVDKIPDNLEDIRASVRERLGIYQRTVTLVTVSRLDTWKRVDRAIRAIARLRVQRLDCQLLVVGDGHLRANLESLARSCGAGDHIRFLGALPHKDVWEILSAADIFLSLYDYSNLCNPLLEAMVAGRCIVSLADGSLEGIITSGHNGILIKPERIEEELTTHLTALMHDEHTRRSLGDSAKRTAERMFRTWEERISQEVGIIKTLCGGGSVAKNRQMVSRS